MSSSLLIYGLFMTALTLALIGSAVYLNGGVGAIRRQAHGLARLGVALTAIFLGIPFVIKMAGNLAWSAGLVAVNVAFIGYLLLRRPSRRAVAHPAERATPLGSTAFLALFIGFVVLATGATILLIVASR